VLRLQRGRLNDLLFNLLNLLWVEQDYCLRQEDSIATEPM
jgi:hypothetical protein